MPKWMKFTLLGCLVFAMLCGVYQMVISNAPVLPSGFYKTPDPTVWELDQTEINQAQVEPGTTDIVMEGAVVCTVATEEEARQVLAELLQDACVAPNGYTAVRSYFTKRVTLSEATEATGVLTREKATALLKNNPNLCPIAVVAQRSERTQAAFDTVTKKDDTIPKGARVIDCLGQDGITETLTETVFQNGAPGEERVITANRVVQEAVTQVERIGAYASDRPNSTPGKHEGERAEGEFQAILRQPMKGAISSNYGMRNGQMHYGIDIEGEAGDVLTAPGAGTVMYAGERGAYGMVVDIDHGNGMVSRIARCTQVKVSVGQTVEQGEEIALLADVDREMEGNIKPHVHMEVLLHGVPYNPRYYLKG